MYTRVVQATIKSKRLAEFKDAVRNHDLPAIRRLPGFVDDIEMYSDHNFLGITFWRTEEDAERYTRELFPRNAARSQPLISYTTLRAEAHKPAHDTIHDVESGALKTVEMTAVRKLAAAAAA